MAGIDHDALLIHRRHHGLKDRATVKHALEG